MSKTKDEIEQQFNKANIKRQQISQIPRSTQEYLQFMDYKIRKQFKSFTLLSLCGGADRANFIIDKSFQRAFLSMTLQQRTSFYFRYICNILKSYQKIKRKQIDLKNISSEHDSQQFTKIQQIPLKVGKGTKSLQQSIIILQDLKAKSKGKSTFNIDLRNYLLRKSKKRNNSYVLEAIKPSDPETVRFAFLTNQDEKKYLSVIQEQINEGLFLGLFKQISDLHKRKMGQKNEQNSNNNNIRQIKLKNPNSKNSNEEKAQLLKIPIIDIHQQQNQQPRKTNNFLSLQSLQQPNPNLSQKSKKPDLNKSVIEDIIKQRDEQQLDEELTQFINQQNQQAQREEQQQRELQSSQFAKKKSNSIQTPQFKPNRQKKYRNIFKIILPNFSLKQLARLNHFGSIYQSNKTQLYVYVNVRDHSLFKMQVVMELPIQVICKAIYNVQLYKYWHPQIDQGQVKLKISSENSCIVYQKTKAFSQWYKQRDYLLLTHMFRLDSAYYIIQKSVQNTNFIPFQSITRGKFLYIVWKIQPEAEAQTSTAPNSNKNKHRHKQKCRVTVQLKVNHEGLLNKNHQKQLTLRYMKGFENMQEYFKNVENQKKLSDLMGFQWVISDVQNYRESYKKSRQSNNQLSLNTVDFQDVSQIQQQQQVYYSIQDLSEQQKQILQQQQHQKSQHEIQQPKVQILPLTSMMSNSQINQKNPEVQNIQTNQEGLIILPKKYLKKRHILEPFQCEKKLMQFSYDNIVEKDHWVLEKGGGLKLINKQKIAAQNNVLKFIMKTLQKNIFSGKGILNISLPVEIFNVDSNLQRLCQSLCLGPQFLQKVAFKGYSDKLERFRRVLAFGLSNSIIYFDVQKPFNPILGQTYQGFIRGCPVYGEQISHHPPISSILFLGRGYKITANIQAKVHVHMNSGDGINQGFYHVIFDNQQIMFHTPPAQISGLAMGDRKFNVKDKGLYIDVDNGYFCQMKMQGTGGLFKKKRQFVDQIQGQIVKVKPEFIRKFLDANIQKKPSPSQSDILQRLGQLSGRWPLNLKIDGQVYYDTHKDVPQRLIDDIYPLNSNSNYREDLFYRKKNDLSRSQIQKQRLEVIQRGDRKFRQKFHGKAH